MGSNWQYSVTWYDVTNLSNFVDITNDVTSIPLFTDTGAPEINTAKVVLSANNGNYISVAPIINEFDRILIIVLDGEGKAYANTYEVKKTVPVEQKGIGTRLELTLVGLERHLQKKNYIKPFYFADAYSVSADIGEYFNANRGTRQPVLAGHDSLTTNKLPNFTVNIFNYGVNEDTCYNRLLEVLDKQGSSTDDGGVLDFFEMNFNCTDASQLNTKIFSSGDITGYTPVILQDTNTVNIGETEAGIESFEGSNLGSWGAQDQGSIPVQYSQFAAKQQAFSLYPTWSATITYPINAIVQLNGITYQSTVNNNFNSNPTGGFISGWNIITQSSLYGNVLTYSPWTRSRVVSWANSGSDVNNNFYGIGCWDGNMVVWDDTTFRTWVHFKATDPTQISSNSSWNKWMYFDGTTRYFYRGFRILINGTGTGAFAGNDVNGVPFANSVAQFDGTRWTVLYRQTSNMQIAVIYEGMCYAYNTTLGWLNLFNFEPDGSIGPQPNGNDCFHPYFAISNQPGMLLTTNPSTGAEIDTPFTANTNSAVEYEYRWNITDLSSTDANYYSIGAWANFSFPFPTSTFADGSGIKVGQLYGGSTSTGREPATFDTQNMHMTHDGLRGFNNVSSEDYGQCQSLDFWMRLKYEITDILDTGFTHPSIPTGEANFNMRCIIYDTADNVIFQDFVVPFNNNWTAISLPINGFQLYRARTPLTNPFGALIPPKALSPANIFQWRNIKHITIQTQDSYDNSGRYAPFAANNLLNPSRLYNPLVGFFNSSSIRRRIKLRIDGFRFTKPLLAITGPDTVWDIEPEFMNKIDIGNYDQLKSDAFSEREKSQYQRIEFDLGSTGKFDIKQGQSFFYRNPRIVNFSDMAPDGISTNTVKLVAKRIEYSITKPSALNKGGLLRTIIGIRRFT